MSAMWKSVSGRLGYCDPALLLVKGSVRSGRGYRFFNQTDTMNLGTKYNLGMRFPKLEAEKGNAAPADGHD